MDWRSPRTLHFDYARGKVFSWILDNRATIRAEVDAILALRPGAIGLLWPDRAATLLGVSKDRLREWATRGVVPVAGQDSFRKWGRENVFNLYEPRDLLEMVETGAVARILKARARRTAARRKAGAIRAKETRERRAALKSEIAGRLREEIAAVVRATGELAMGHRLELWVWARRVSRLAKTRPSQADAAYDLKDLAVSTLFEAEALETTFVPANEVRLRRKCDYHAMDWFPFEELMACNACHFEEDHYRSLYAHKLAGIDGAGTLHTPYQRGLTLGYPPMNKLKNADHSRYEDGVFIRFGSALDEDEAAIFKLDTCRAEIERLAALIEARLSSSAAT